MKTRTKQAYAAALIAAAGLVAVPAAAGVTQKGLSTLNSVAVGYRDLNLAAPEGVAVLRSRLRAAARAVCGAPEREEVRAVFAQRKCVEQSIARALRDADSKSHLIASLR